jgi:hypothetical protein
METEVNSMGPVSELAPVPWVRERDIDLLLAQLCRNEPEFVAWLVNERSIRHEALAPTGEPSVAHAAVNYSRSTAGGDATGESDVIVEALYPDGNLLLSIENKAWAAAQPLQGLRHRLFVESQGRTWGLAVLIAPAAWIEGHPNEVGAYHLDVSLEEIAEWCLDRSPVHDFLAAVLRQACTEASDGIPAPDLQEWFDSIDQVLIDNHGMALAPQKLTRVAAEGRARPGRFIACREDTVEPVPGIGPAWLMLKTASANHKGRANVSVYKAPRAFVDFVEQAADGQAFEIRHSKAGTLMVDNPAPGAETWTTGQFEHQVDEVHAIARAAHELRTWWDANVTGVDWESDV